MDTFRKIISLVLFTTVVISAGVFFFKASTQPLKYQYEDEIAYQTTDELYQFLHTIPMKEIKSIKIENISEKLPNNLSDYLMVRVSTQLLHNSTVELPLTHDYPTGWKLFVSWVCISISFAALCFGIIRPHDD